MRHLASFYNVATREFDLKHLMHSILDYSPAIEKIECTWWSASCDLSRLPLICLCCQSMISAPGGLALDRMQGAPWASVRRMLLRHQDREALPRTESIAGIGAWLDSTHHWSCNEGYCCQGGCIRKGWPDELRPAVEQVMGYGLPGCRGIQDPVDHIGKNLHTLILTVRPLFLCAVLCLVSHWVCTTH